MAGVLPQPVDDTLTAQPFSRDYLDTGHAARLDRPSGAIFIYRAALRHRWPSAATASLSNESPGPGARLGRGALLHRAARPALRSPAPEDGLVDRGHSPRSAQRTPGRT